MNNHLHRLHVNLKEVRFKRVYAINMYVYSVHTLHRTIREYCIVSTSDKLYYFYQDTQNFLSLDLGLDIQDEMGR